MIQITNDALKIFLERAFDSNPTRNSMNNFGIGKSQTTPVVTDTSLDSQVEFDAVTGDYKSFETGYPSLNETTMETTCRGIISDTQCNGETINAAALFNNDDTPLMGGLGSFTGIAKTTSKRIIIIFKVKARQTIEV